MHKMRAPVPAANPRAAERGKSVWEPNAGAGVVVNEHRECVHEQSPADTEIKFQFIPRKCCTNRGTGKVSRKRKGRDIKRAQKSTVKTRKILTSSVSYPIDPEAALCLKHSVCASSWMDR